MDKVRVFYLHYSHSSVYEGLNGCMSGVGSAIR